MVEQDFGPVVEGTPLKHCWSLPQCIDCLDLGATSVPSNACLAADNSPGWTRASARARRCINARSVRLRRDLAVAALDAQSSPASVNACHSTPHEHFQPGHQLRSWTIAKASRVAARTTSTQPFLLQGLRERRRGFQRGCSNPTKQKTTQREKKERKMWRERKKTRNFGPPHPSGPHVFQVWAPTLRFYQTSPDALA